MRILINHLSRRPNGGLASTRTQTETNVVRFGRGTDNEVHLADVRVPLSACRLMRDAGALHLQAMGSFEFTYGGEPARHLLINPGDEVMMGPYRVALLPGDGEIDVGVEVELVAPPEGDFERLLANSQLSLNATLPSRRILSWALFASILLMFFAFPLAFVLLPTSDADGAKLPLDMVWQSGPLTKSHAMLGAECSACHQEPFVMVRDSACTACHADTGNHVPVERASLPALTETRCGSCHKEHGGHSLLVRADSGLCTDCHGRLDELMLGTELVNVSDFDRSHPEFQPSIIQDPLTGVVQRHPIGGSVPLKENSGLIFPHDSHLLVTNPDDPQGPKIRGAVRGPNGPELLECASCHVPEPGGAGFRPVDMETQCADCHELKFDKHAPERLLPHGKPAEINAMVRDFYAKAGLRGGYPDPEGPPAIRRRPGTPLEPEVMDDVVAWAERTAEDKLRFVFGKSLCASCHLVETPTESISGEWDVVPVRVTDRWLPKGEFHHQKHSSVDCATCHEAERSEMSSDVLLPSIAECRTCHANEGTVAKVSSPCTECHIFHNPHYGPMRPERLAAMPR